MSVDVKSTGTRLVEKAIEIWKLAQTAGFITPAYLPVWSADQGWEHAPLHARLDSMVKALWTII